MKKSSVFVILPAYNESKYITQVVKELELTGFSFIVVDDGSSDKTAELAGKIAPHVLRHRINLGKGAALRTGSDYAFKKLDAEAVIYMDSDAQHKTEELEDFYAALKAGHEMVLGVRAFDSTMPLVKIMGNRLSSLLVLIFFGRYIPDVPSGYKAMTKKMYQKLKLTSSGYSIELEIAVKLARHKLPFKVVPITTIYHDLERGFQPLDALAQVINLIKWRFQL